VMRQNSHNCYALRSCTGRYLRLFMWRVYFYGLTEPGCRPKSLGFFTVHYIQHVRTIILNHPDMTEIRHAVQEFFLVRSASVIITSFLQVFFSLKNL